MLHTNFSSYDLRQLAAHASKELVRDLERPSDGQYWLFDSPIDVERFVEALTSYSNGGQSADELSETPITVDGWRTKEIAYLFVKKFFENIRAVICGKQGAKAAKAADLSAKGVATAIASTVASSLGTSSALAIAVTTVALIVLGGAAKKAFCEMTEAEVLAAIKK
jgi:hypothetical protein